ncbi:hypothetical protein B0H15DRAFT_1025929 [Mycena belliarum]|uniref:Uncharacterized protein n=1 Tax=Mycena belliarum TaxID=1033014 RepID=A0AAD6TSH9_9AGAR|nr:hypothetical protein B0H15DRAFT_1025929 [Mycena belliae]
MALECILCLPAALPLAAPRPPAQPPHARCPPPCDPPPEPQPALAPPPSAPQLSHPVTAPAVGQLGLVGRLRPREVRLLRGVASAVVLTHSNPTASPCAPCTRGDVHAPDAGAALINAYWMLGNDEGAQGRIGASLRGRARALALRFVFVRVYEGAFWELDAEERGGAGRAGGEEIGDGARSDTLRAESEHARRVLMALLPPFVVVPFRVRVLSCFIPSSRPSLRPSHSRASSVPRRSFPPPALRVLTLPFPGLPIPTFAPFALAPPPPCPAPFLSAFPLCVYRSHSDCWASFMRGAACPASAPSTFRTGGVAERARRVWVLLSPSVAVPRLRVPPIPVPISRRSRVLCSSDLPIIHFLILIRLALPSFLSSSVSSLRSLILYPSTLCPPHHYAVPLLRSVLCGMHDGEGEGAARRITVTTLHGRFPPYALGDPGEHGDVLERKEEREADAGQPLTRGHRPPQPEHLVLVLASPSTTCAPAFLPPLALDCTLPAVHPLVHPLVLRAPTSAPSLLAPPQIVLRMPVLAYPASSSSPRLSSRPPRSPRLSSPSSLFIPGEAGGRMGAPPFLARGRREMGERWVAGGGTRRVHPRRYPREECEAGGALRGAAPTYPTPARPPADADSAAATSGTSASTSPVEAAQTGLSAAEVHAAPFAAADLDADVEMNDIGDRWAARDCVRDACDDEGLGSEDGEAEGDHLPGRVDTAESGGRPEEVREDPQRVAPLVSGAKNYGGDSRTHTGMPRTLSGRQRSPGATRHTPRRRPHAHRCPRSCPRHASHTTPLVAAPPGSAPLRPAATHRAANKRLSSSGKRTTSRRRRRHLTQPLSTHVPRQRAHIPGPRAHLRTRHRDGNRASVRRRDKLFVVSESHADLLAPTPTPT